MYKFIAIYGKITNTQYGKNCYKDWFYNLKKIYIPTSKLEYYSN